MDASPARRRSALGLVVSGLALAAAALYLHRSGQSNDGVSRARRSVLLVTLDTTRADHLAPYGGHVPVPTLSALAETGVVYEQAYAVAPITLVAHTSLLTGLWPPQTGVRNNGIHAASPDLLTLAERLAGRGYRTAAFISAAVLEKRYGLDQGFEHYDDDLSSGRHRLPRMVPDRPASATVDSVLAWLDALGERESFFVWAHFYDPHAPYLPPSPFREAWPGRPYDGEIAYLDQELGRLLAHPRLRDVVTAVVGDHGESLGEHGEQTHALLAHDSTLRVPFILRWPGGARARFRAPVSQVDLVPSLLDLLGLGVDDELPGTSVIPGSRRARVEARRPLYAETYLPHYTYGWSKLRSVRRGPLKLIEGSRSELFDLRFDPRELSDLAAQQPGALHDLSRDLEQLTASFGEDREATQRLDAESEAELRSLGYLAAGALPERDGPPPHPKDMIEVHTGLERARLLQADALYDLAAIELQKVLEKDPENLSARIDLAENLAAQGELQAAAAEAERALASDPSSVRLHLQLASIESRRRRHEQALALTERALELAPGDVEALLQRALLLRALGRRGEMARALESALVEHPGHPRLLTAQASLVLGPAGDLEATEAHLRRACAADPFLAIAHRRLGELLERTGRAAEALEIYGQALERRPRDAELQARLGQLLASRVDQRAAAGTDVAGSGAAGLGETSPVEAGPVAAGTDAAGPGETSPVETSAAEAVAAEAHLREAIRLSPRPRSDLFLTLARLLERGGRADEAAELYRRLAEREVAGPRELNNRALALWGLGRLGEARAQLETLLAERPQSADALANLAAVCAELGDWPSAENAARRLLERQPASADAWNNLGVALEGQGRTAEAGRAYRRALELDPAYWRARSNLDQLAGEGGAE